MDWLFLIIAGLFEVGFTTSLKLTEDFTKIVPTLIFVACTILSFWFLNRSLETIPLGIAYAIWTGIGAAGTMVIAALFFKEEYSYLQIFFLCNLIFSLVGLKLMTA